MPQEAHVPQTNFVRGEVDPELIGRNDIKVYQQAAKRMRNTSLKPQGGFRRRPGTKFLADVTVLTAGLVQMAEFVFGEGLEYTFAFTNLKLTIFDINGNSLQTLVAPWTNAQLARLCWAQSAGTLLVTHPQMWPQAIIRNSAGVFTIANTVFETAATGAPIYQPYFKFAPAATTLASSTTVIGAATFTAAPAYWVAGHVGMKIRYNGKQCTITAVTNGTTATGTVDETLSAATATTVWDEQLFSAVYGYPGICAFHDQRTCYGGHLNIPDGFWASKTGAPWNHNLGTALDSDAIAVALGSTDLNEIRGIVSGRHLQIFTDNGPFYVPTADTKPVTPTNCGFRRQAPFGSARIRPRILDGATIFIQKQANVCRELLFTYLQNAYTASSISLLSGHLLTQPTNIAVVFGGASQPNDFAFALNSDGTLAQFQSVRAEELAGWCGWNTAGSFLAMAAVAYELIVIVQRQIAGVTKYYMEKFDWSATSTLDCALTVTPGVPTTVFGGFNHLIGQLVQVTSGVLYVGQFMVDGLGQITTPDTYTTITAGLDYVVDVETLPADGNFQDGPATMEVRSIIKAIVRFSNTMAATVAGERMNLRKVTDDLSIPVAPFTGPREFYVRGWSNDPTVKITQEVPLQMTVLSMLMELAA